MKVGALHRGTGKTKQNANNRKLCIVVGRENCGAVDRRQIDGKKMERKPRLKQKKKWMERKICKPVDIISLSF